MRRPFLLRFPKTQDGIDISTVLREAKNRPRGTVPSMLTIAVMAWAGSDRDHPPWTPLKNCEKVYCWLDPVSPSAAPIYQLWEKSQSQMPFDAWLAMAVYYGFVRIRRDKFLTPLWDVFTGSPGTPPRVDIDPSPKAPVAKREPSTAPAPRASEGSASPSAGVKKLKGMF
jgi:hypothetical protein